MFLSIMFNLIASTEVTHTEFDILGPTWMAWPKEHAFSSMQLQVVFLPV